MYGKLIDNNLIEAPDKLEGDGVIVYNPPASMYITQGWKPIEFTEHDEPPEGYEYVYTWEEQKSKIVQVWRLVELSDEISADEALSIIMGGEY